MKRTFLVAALILVASPPLHWTHANGQTQTKDQKAWIGTETVNTRFGDFEFKNGYPTAEATDKLYQLRTFNRAVESYLDFVTLMSMFYMQKGLNDFGLDASNKFLIFESLLDAQSLFLTPNTESIYGMQFLDLRSPAVLPDQQERPIQVLRRRHCASGVAIHAGLRDSGRSLRVKGQ